MHDSFNFLLRKELNLRLIIYVKVQNIPIWPKRLNKYLKMLITLWIYLSIKELDICLYLN